MTRRPAPAPRARRRTTGALAAAALLPALLAGCGEDGPGSAPDFQGDRAPDPARVSTPAPVVGEQPEVPRFPGGDAGEGDEGAAEDGDSG